jgi:hypothetical protein
VPVISPKQPPLNQGVPWNTSQDGKGHYNDGPALGQYNQPSHTPANGYSNNTPSATPLNAPGGDDYTAWNWEQVLNGVLGMQLPDRSLISSLRWTVTDGQGEGSSLFQIFGFPGGGFVPSFYVYLTPDLQGAGGPWDEYYNTPVSQFSQMFSSAPPDYTTVAVDPRTFGSAGAAFDGVENLYHDAFVYFYDTSNDLQSQASQYKGQAGEAFYNLINNLFTSAQSISFQMGSSLDPNSYGGRLAQSGTDTHTFVVGLWQTIGAWQERLDHSPLGAIYQALLDGNVVSGTAGSYYIPNVLDAGSFGDLLSGSTWQSIESAAKTLWLNSIQETLDASARSLINALSVSYLTTAGLLQPLTAPTLSQISSNLNTGDLNNLGGLNSYDDGLNNIGAGFANLGAGIDDSFNSLDAGFGSLGAGFDSGLNSIGAGFGNLGAGLDGGFNSLGGELGAGLDGGLNSLGGGLGNLGTGLDGGLNSLGGGVRGVGGLNSGSELNGLPSLNGGSELNGVPALNSPGNGPNMPGGLGGLPGLGAGLGNTGGLGGVASGNSTLGQLQTALGDNTAQRQALEKALALAPSSGPLHNALEQALADNGVVQGALRSALAGTTPAGTALQAALNGNGEVQSELNRALDSGLVPKTGPLRTALQQASGDNSHTGTALRNALGSAAPGGDALHAALTDNGKVQGALRHMLASGQIPRTGPLHDAIESALAKSQQARQALDQALASGGSPGVNSIQHALADNRAVQHELTTALASGQIPPAGPLHSELQAALAGSRSLSSDLRQALTSVGVPAEPVPVVPELGLPAGQGLLGLPGGSALHALLGGGGPGGSPGGGLGGAGGMPAFTGGLGNAPRTAAAGTTGPAATNTLSGLTGGAPAAPVSSGRFVPSTDGTAQTPAGTGSSAVPFYPPMAGSGSGMGGQQGQQERERTTWLAEDEDVWGTDPAVGPSSIGRDFADLDEDTDSYDDLAEPTTASRRTQYRQGAY